MALETKVIDTKSYFSFQQQDLIDLFSSFGWQTIGVTDTRVTMNRDNNIANYMELVTLEREFNIHLLKVKEAYLKKQFVFKTFLILFLLLIFPGILYIVSRKKWSKIYFSELRTMRKTAEKAKNIFYSTN
ncbi:hypothetical protein ACJA27_00865 [Mycoplasmopsis lipophila]|uniref:hypothetical protein n=1 Tax=Mycoplasmopsis lipophila TaxID=2117 RepID=UPI0038739B44